MGPGTKLSILPPREKRRRNFRSIGGGISQIVSRRKYRKVGENILPRLGGGRVWKKYSTTQAFRNSLAFLPPPNPSPQNGKIDFLLPVFQNTTRKLFSKPSKRHFYTFLSSVDKKSTRNNFWDKKLFFAPFRPVPQILFHRPLFPPAAVSTPPPSLSPS